MIELNLTKDMLVQMLGDPVFFEKCTHFLHIKDQGIACYNKYVETMYTGCKGCGDLSIAAPAISEFVRHSKKLLEIDPQILECVKDYIGTKRPRRPDTVTIRHKYDGSPELLIF